jgi:hypothetical protein
MKVHESVQEGSILLERCDRLGGSLQKATWIHVSLLNTLTSTVRERTPRRDSNFLGANTKRLSQKHYLDCGTSKLESASDYRRDLIRDTHAAVTANTSVLFASVNIVNNSEMTALNPATTATLTLMLFSTIKTMIDSNVWSNA